MKLLSTAAASLAVVLVVGPAGHLSAQSSQLPQAQQGPGAHLAPQEPAPTPPPTRPRHSKRLRRASARRPSPSVRGALEQGRPSRDGGPVRQDLTLTTNALGGYDSNLPAAYGTGPGLVPSAMASGATRSVDATLGYFRGNTLRSIRMDTTANLLSYPGYLPHPVAGGAATFAGRTTVGRSLVFGVSERVGYEPLFTVFSPGAATGPLPTGLVPAVPLTGLFERRSLSSYSALSLERQWSERDSTSLSYSYGLQRFTDGEHGDNSAHDVLAEYRRSIAGGLRARTAYRYVNADCIDYNGTRRPTTEHRIEGGPEITTALSRRRRLMMSFAAGAGHIESVGASRQVYQAWMPVASAGATVALSPRWSLDSGYRRGFSLLRGITDEVYTTDTAFLTTGGSLTRRTDVRVGGTYSSWRTSLIPGLDDRFTVYGASAQLRVAVSRTVAATAGYSYYHHRYSNPGELPAGFPAVYGRHAVNVGVTVWIPLLGNSSRPPLIWR